MCCVKGKFHLGFPWVILNNSQIRFVKVTNGFDFLHEVVFNIGNILLFNVHSVATKKPGIKGEPMVEHHK